MTLTIWNRLKICFEVLTSRSGHKQPSQEKQLSLFKRGYKAGLDDAGRRTGNDRRYCRDYEAEIYLLKAEIKRLGEFEDYYIRTHKHVYVAAIVQPYEEKIKRLEADVERLTDAMSFTESKALDRVAELEEEIKNLRCCGNCTYFYDNVCSKFPTIDVEYCDKWQSDELTAEDRK